MKPQRLERCFLSDWRLASFISRACSTRARAIALARDCLLRAAAVAPVEATSVTLIAEGSPLPVAQKPKAVTLPFGATAPAQEGASTVTVLPLRLTVPLQLCVIFTAVGSVKTSFQLLDVAVPVLATLKLRQ